MVVWNIKKIMKIFWVRGNLFFAVAFYRVPYEEIPFARVSI